MKTAIVLALTATIVASLCPEANADRLVASIGGQAQNARRIEVTATDLTTTQTGPIAEIVVAGTAAGIALGAPVVVAAGDKTVIFKGEVVAIEPLFSSGSEARTMIRGFDRTHRLTRGAKTRVFEDKTDSDIVTQIAAENGLSADVKHDVDITHDAVYQHNQTDLEFLLERAARIGFEVFVDDTKLVFRRRGDAPVLSLACQGAEVDLRVLYPRTASAGLVKQVTVRGWDPAKQMPIEGVATARRLLPFVAGDSRGVDLGELATLSTAGQAHAVARATLEELTAGEVSAEAASEGNPKVKPGVVVTIEASPAPFSGKYYVTGVQHKYGSGDGSGYSSILRLLRGDRGWFSLPEVDDEVLVAFVGGDITRPIIVGSLWNSRDPVPTTTCSDRR